MSGLRFGVLAEDRTDIEALDVLIRRLAAEISGQSIGIKPYASGGCARLRIRAQTEMKLMANQGCAALVLVHDLDRDPDNGQLNNEDALRRSLESIEIPAGLPRLICIPVEELEAWFWSDQKVVDAIGRGQGKAHPSPHRLPKPKEALVKLSIGANKKPRYDTNDNKKLAEILDLTLCAQRCPAFGDLRAFVRGIVAKSA